MALTGSNFLATADASVDDQWTYVREHLDGIWGNNANVDVPTERALWHKVTTRTLITEWPLQAPDAAWWPPLVFSGAQAGDSGLNICREAIALYAYPASEWDGITIGRANAVYVTNPDAAPWERYHGVFTEWQPWSFEDGGFTDAAEQAFEGAKGAAFECPLNGCSGGVLSDYAVDLITRIHAQGHPFVWFASNNLGDASAVRSVDWLSEFKQTYNHFAALGLLQPDDVVMVINYDIGDSGTGVYPPVPRRWMGERPTR
jgi:hypothetical protein